MDGDGFSSGCISERGHSVADEIHAHGDARHPRPVGRQVEGHGLNDVGAVDEIEAVKPGVSIAMRSELADVKSGARGEEHQENADCGEDGVIGGGPSSDGKGDVVTKDATEEGTNAGQRDDGQGDEFGIPAETETDDNGGVAADGDAKDGADNGAGRAKLRRGSEKDGSNEIPRQHKQNEREGAVKNGWVAGDTNGKERQTQKEEGPKSNHPRDSDCAREPGRGGFLGKRWSGDMKRVFAHSQVEMMELKSRRVRSGDFRIARNLRE